MQFSSLGLHLLVSEGKSDTAATAREERSRACPHSRRGLTPLWRLQKYPKIHVSTGEESSASGPDSTQGEHLLKLGNIQEPLRSRRHEAHFCWGISRLTTPNLWNFQRVLHTLAATQEVPRHTRSSSHLSIMVVSSAYLSLLIFLPAILIPAHVSSIPAFFMMYSAYKLNKQGDDIQPWHTPFPFWNQSVVPCPALTVASWSSSRFLKRQVRWSGIPISFRIVAKTTV